MSLDALLQRADVWRGGQTPPAAGSVPTGFTALDAVLPGGGWPLGALSEILLPREGLGAVSLALPALARLSREDRWLAWIAPPHVPYAPALAQAGIDLSRVLLVHPHALSDALWAVEQALRSGTCGAVLAWLAGAEHSMLRRLQLAAETGKCWGLLFRPPSAAREPSPAALRLSVEAGVPRGTVVHVLKRRGGRLSAPLYLEDDHPRNGS